MLLSFVKWRRLFKSFVFLSSGGSLAVFIFSLVSIFAYGKPYTWLLVASVFFNYLLTLFIVVRLLHFKKQEPLFINCYLFVFLMFPFLGVMMYSLFDFGLVHIDYVKECSKMYRKYKKNEKAYSLAQILKTTDNLPRTFIYNYRKYKVPIYNNPGIFILENSYQILQGLADMLSGAKKFIHMEFYVFSDGLVFRYIYEILKKKIQEGVEVRLIIDYWGNMGRIKRRTIRDLKKIGVHVKWFNSCFSFGNLCSQFRNHNKVVVVDNEYAWFGSCNIADEYFNITDKYFQTTELSVKLSGNIVESVNALFLAHWELLGGKPLQEDVCVHSYSTSELDPEENVWAQFIDNSPVSNEFIIRDNLIQLIFSAKKSIVISTPYFFPPDELINALKFARSSGVLVRILVPQNPDLIDFFRTLNSQKFELLLKEGIEVYEYLGFNHEKLMIVDEEVVYIGSYNWDYRSLCLNFENALLLKCPKIATQLSTFMFSQFTNSHRIIKEDLKRFKKFVLFNAFIRLFKAFL